MDCRDPFPKIKRTDLPEEITEAELQDEAFVEKYSQHLNMVKDITKMVRYWKKYNF